MSDNAEKENPVGEGSPSRPAGPWEQHRGKDLCPCPCACHSDCLGCFLIRARLAALWAWFQMGWWDYTRERGT